jgi:hypothetical protein
MFDIFGRRTWAKALLLLLVCQRLVFTNETYDPKRLRATKPELAPAETGQELAERKSCAGTLRSLPRPPPGVLELLSFVCLPPIGT